MRFDRFTLKAQQAVQGAQELAQTMSNAQIEPAHLMRTLLAQDEGLVRPVLKKLEVDPQKVIQGIDDILKKLPRVSGAAQVYLSPGLNQILDDAFKLATQMKDEYVSTEHLLLALAQAKDSEVSHLFASLGLSPEAIMQALAGLEGFPKGYRPVAGGKIPAAGEIWPGPHRIGQEWQT